MTLAETLYPIAPGVLVTVTLLSLAIAAVLVVVVASQAPDNWRKRRRIRELNSDLAAVQRLNRELTEANTHMRHTIGLLQPRRHGPTPLADTQRIERQVPPRPRMERPTEQVTQPIVRPQARHSTEATGPMPIPSDYGSSAT